MTAINQKSIPSKSGYFSLYFLSCIVTSSDIMHVITQSNVLRNVYLWGERFRKQSSARGTVVVRLQARVPKGRAVAAQMPPRNSDQNIVKHFVTLTTFDTIKGKGQQTLFGFILSINELHRELKKNISEQWSRK